MTSSGLQDTCVEAAAEVVQIGGGHHDGMTAVAGVAVPAAAAAAAAAAAGAGAASAAAGRAATSTAKCAGINDGIARE
eukprot:360265-Chlamydomonas_euryale.AAC.3